MRARRHAQCRGLRPVPARTGSLRDGTDTAVRPAIELFRGAVRRIRSSHRRTPGSPRRSRSGIWRIGCRRDIDEALAASSRALELEPHMPEACLARASAVHAAPRRPRRDRAFEEAIRLNPASFEAYYSTRDIGSGRGREVGGALRARAPAARRLPGALPAGRRAVKLGDEASGCEVAVARCTRSSAARHRPDDGRALQLGPAHAAARLREQARGWPSARSKARRRVRDALQRRLRLCGAGRQRRGARDARQAVRHGRGNLDWIEHDPDFDRCDGDPRFDGIVGRLRGRREGRARERRRSRALPAALLGLVAVALVASGMRRTTG